MRTGTKRGTFICPECGNNTVRISRKTEAQYAPVYVDNKTKKVIQPNPFTKKDSYHTESRRSFTSTLTAYSAHCTHKGCTWSASEVDYQDRATRKEVVASNGKMVYSLGFVDKAKSDTTKEDLLQDDRYSHAEPSIVPGMTVRKLGPQADYDKELQENMKRGYARA